MAELEPEVLKEVPADLQRLTRMITRGFYSMEHAFVMDLLVRNACVKEDDMVAVLHYDRKQLRQVINALKNDKLIKARLRVETDSEGKTTRHNYYFINYSVFVNVVKYKLDHMRKKIEMEEKNNTSRASFKCPKCGKTYTDLDMGELLQRSTMEMLCIYCGTEVEEDMSAASRSDARTLLAKFNDQMKPIYELLQQCENLKLAPEVLEPEPVDLRKRNKDRLGAPRGSDRGQDVAWSGSASKGLSFGQQSTEMTISLGNEERAAADKVKDTPVWMKHSTVDGVAMETQEREKPSTSLGQAAAPRAGAVDQDDIRRTLLVHEAKPADNLGGGGQSDSSDSEEAAPAPVASSSGNVEEMESDDDDDDPLVTVGDQRLAYHDVTEEMVARMTPAEKEEYIRIGQELYQNMYEY